jgi:hypothetical protein
MWWRGVEDDFLVQTLRNMEEEEDEGEFLARKLRNVREEEEGLFLAQTLRKVREEEVGRFPSADAAEGGGGGRFHSAYAAKGKGGGVV